MCTCCPCIQAYAFGAWCACMNTMRQGADSGGAGLPTHVPLLHMHALPPHLHVGECMWVESPAVALGMVEPRCGGVCGSCRTRTRSSRFKPIVRRVGDDDELGAASLSPVVVVVVESWRRVHAPCRQQRRRWHRRTTVAACVWMCARAQAVRGSWRLPVRGTQCCGICVCRGVLRTAVSLGMFVSWVTLQAHVVFLLGGPSFGSDL